MLLQIFMEKIVKRKWHEITESEDEFVCSENTADLTFNNKENEEN